MKARGKRDGNLELPDMVAPTLNEGFILAALEKYQRDTKSPGWLARICWHAGTLEMTVDNPLAQAFFEIGKTYYLDFSKAE
jgi:hypothetical protein